MSLSDSSKLPSIRSLIAFEATARLGSMTAAAMEEGSTQPAMSQRVRALEEQLGVVVFNRQGGVLTLTEQGEAFYLEVAPALAQIRAAVNRLGQSVENLPSTITIAAGAGFTHVWLLPRLEKLELAFPGHVFKLVPIDRDEAPEMQQADISIRFGPLETEQQGDIIVSHEDVFPVCSPDYAASLDLPKELTAESLEQLSLLHLDIQDPRWLDWREWCGHLGWPKPPIAGAFTYNNYPLLMNAAISGQGVALGWSTVIRDYIEGGRLVALGPHVVRMNYGYKLNVKYHRSAVLEPITQWLVNEFRV